MLPRYNNLTDSPTTAISKTAKGIVIMDHVTKESSCHDEESDGHGNDTTDDTVSSTARPKRKFRIIDETQLSEEEARKLELRRAYNRDCASRARTRTKTLVQELQDQVRQLKEEKEELRQANTSLQACLSFSEKQNRDLIAKQSLIEGRSAYPVGLGQMNGTAHHSLGLSNAGNNNAATSLLMLQVQQQRQQQELLQHALLRQQQQAAAATLNASKLFPLQNGSMALTNNDLAIRDQLMNVNSPSNSKLYEAFARLNESKNKQN
jgi:hypothetical protein